MLHSIKTRIFQAGFAFIIMTTSFFSLAAHADDATAEANVVKIAVTDQSPQTLQKILPQAFAQALIKISGDANIVSRPAIQQALSQANNWLDSYQYQNETASTGESQQYLVAQFDKDGMTQLLQGVGSQASVPQQQKQQTVQDSHVKLIISGVNNLDDYALLLKAIQHLPAVTHVHLSDMNNSIALFDVEVDGGKEALEKSLAAASQLTSMADMNVVAERADLYYQWNGVTGAHS